MGALTGIPVGRLLQRFGPRPMMVLGSVLGTVSVVGVALAPTFATFAAAWVATGIATAGLHYSPAFAALTGWFGTRRLRAIMTLTLAGGFASTIFAPFTEFLDGRLGWRGAYLVLAAIVLVVTLPAHSLVLRLPWAPQRHAARRPDREVLASRSFLMLATAGTLTSFVSYASLVALPVLLLARGDGSVLAAWAIGLAGAGQVGGRLAYGFLNRWFRPRPRAVVVISVLAVALLAQALIPGPAWLSIGIAVLGGAGRGLFTLVNATLPADLRAPERYAAISGVYQAPLAAAGALAPGTGAAIAVALGGYPTLFAVLSLVCAAAVAVALGSGQPRPNGRQLPVAKPLAD